jgi:hypothetical protein
MIWQALQGLDVDLRDERVPGYAGRAFEPIGSLIHHTAAGGTSDLPSLSVCKFGRGTPGASNYLPGPLCQVLIGRRGTVAVITDGYGNHAGAGSHPAVGTDGNRRLIGIEIENNGAGEPYPAVQYDAAVKVTRRLADRFGDLVLGHKEWCLPVGRKIDPSFDMGEFRALVATTTPEVPDMTPAEFAAAIGGKTVRGIDGRDYVYVETATDGDKPLAAVLGWTYDNVRRPELLAQRVDDLIDDEAIMAKLAAGVGGVAIDYDLLATKVADKLAQRLAS